MLLRQHPETSKMTRSQVERGGSPMAPRTKTRRGSSIAIFCFLSLSSYFAAAQSCPAGIPSAGNPACIPPSVPGSPYYTPPSARSSRPPEGRWLDVWGAIVMDGVDSVVGITDDDSSEEAAVQHASRRCMAGGGKQCRLLITFSNQCVAMAWPPSGGTPTAATGPLLQQVKKQAIDACKDSAGKACYVSYASCIQPKFKSR